MSLGAIGARLRAASWPQILAYALSLAVFGKLAVTASPAADHPQLRHLGLVLAMLLLASKDIAHAPEALDRLRSAHATRAPWQRYLTALLPPGLVGMFRLDRLMWLGMVQRILRRPRPTASQGQPLTYLERGSYGTARALVFASMLLELPVHTLLLNLWIKNPDTLLVLHIVGAIGILYLLAWALGDRWHLGAGCHVLAGDELHLRVGVRTEGVLPLAAVERMEMLDVPLPTWRRKRGLAPRDGLTVTPFDQPNCVLVLREDAQVDILHQQVRRRLPRQVFLYLDRPGILASRLHARAPVSPKRD